MFEPEEDDNSDYGSLQELKIFSEKCFPEDEVQELEEDDSPRMSLPSLRHPDAEESDEMGFGLDMCQGIEAGMDDG